MQTKNVIVATRQKSNDFTIVSLLHRNNFIACHIAIAPWEAEYKSTLSFEKIGGLSCPPAGPGQVLVYFP
jgi:hypothetical protein